MVGCKDSCERNFGFSKVWKAMGPSSQHSMYAEDMRQNISQQAHQPHPCHSVGCCCIWNYRCWYGGSTFSGRWSLDVSYACTPVRYIVWFTWNWPRHCPMIPLFKHFQNLFPDVDGQHLSTATMRPIFRISQCPSEEYCSEVSSIKAQWERYKRNLQVFWIYWWDNHQI
jgi:hypothetical protein